MCRPLITMPYEWHTLILETTDYTEVTGISMWSCHEGMDHYDHTTYFRNFRLYLLTEISYAVITLMNHTWYDSITYLETLV